jgi:hypothetical protein
MKSRRVVSALALAMAIAAGAAQSHPHAAAAPRGADVTSWSY